MRLLGQVHEVTHCIVESVLGGELAHAVDFTHLGQDYSLTDHVDRMDHPLLVPEQPFVHGTVEEPLE